MLLLTDFLSFAGKPGSRVASSLFGVLFDEDLIVNKTLIAGAVALISLASSSAFAQSYVGVNLGASHADHGCGAAEASGAITSCDKNDFAWKLTGGYQLPGTPWAGELTYFDLGKFKGSGTGTSADAKDSYWGLGGAYRPDFGSGWGGVARVGQIQLLQPFFTLAFAALFLGETFSLRALLTAAVVAVSILVSRKTKIQHVSLPR